MARVALVTGGSRGIGAAISVALKAAGYKVAANYAGNDEAARAFTAETGIPTYKWSVADYHACKAGIAQVEADLGPREAAAWLRALAKPPPSLADKLGIAPERAVLRLGPVTDAALLAAVGQAGDGPPALALAEVETLAALEAVLEAMAAHPGLPLWTVTPKGADSPLPDATLRARMRAAGWRDAKSCAVSPRMTACRWHPPAIAAPGA